MHYRPLTIRTQTDSTDAGKADDNEYMTSTLSEIREYRATMAEENLIGC